MFECVVNHQFWDANVLCFCQREKDAAINAAARRVVLWSAVAFVSTILSLAVTIGLGFRVQLVNVDVTMNTFAICMQYPGAITTLAGFSLGWDAEEVAEMVPVQKENVRESV